MEPDSVRHVFEGKLISLDVESWGDKEREVVRHPGSCAILASLPGDQVILVRQFREAVRRSLLEVPAGVMDEPGETAERCALRELMEETGFHAVDVQSLGRFHASAGVTTETFELFVGRAVHAYVPYRERNIEVVLMPFAKALDAVRRGEITDAKTVIALLLAKDRPGYAGSRPAAEAP
ncbi:MAG TPA: NUDIX hydrolase [Actinomycetota bacterium]